MAFDNQLSLYAETIGFSFKELAEASDISTGTLSNYRSGKLIPKINNPKIRRLAKGISLLAQNKGIELTEDEVLAELNKCISGGMSVSADDYLANVVSSAHLK